MIRAIRWLLFGLGALFVLGIFTVTGLWWFRHLHEGTYYGPHSDILPVGTRVFAAQEFASAGSGPIARNTFGIVQAESACDEDSSDQTD
jgi:hypothetical protein